MFWLVCVLLPLVAAAAPVRRVSLCDDDKEPPTLDPFVEFSEKNHTIIQQILEGLVQFSPEGNVVPALAESWEQLTPTQLRFHLRPGVRFHNGEPFDAESVRFSLEGYIASDGRYPGKAFFSSIDHVVVVDARTVDLMTRYPDGVLLRRLAGLITMVPPGYYQKTGSVGFSRSPVGTGPFKFERWIPGHEIVLIANRGYWDKGLPRIDELSFRFLPPADQVKALLSGDVDLVVDMPGTMTLQVKRNPGTTVLKNETLFTVGATFNVSRWPLSDPRFRRALNHAVDRSELIRYDLLGNGRSVATLSLPRQIGHDPDLRPYAFDLKKARSLLKEVGVQTPYHLKTLVRSVRPANILAKQLLAIGIVLDMETGTESDMFKKFREQGWDMGIAGMSDPTAHSSFIQGILLYSKSPYSIFKSTDYDHRLEAFTSALSEEDQESKGRELDRFVHSQALSLFTYQRVQTYGMSRRVRFTPYLTVMPYFRSIEIVAASEPGRHL